MALTLQACRLAKEKFPPYDLIFMDCEMPEMNGFEATEKIRAWEKQHILTPIHITALTAHVLAEQLERCKACGMDDYLLKPVELNKLREHLQDAIGF